MDEKRKMTETSLQHCGGVVQLNDSEVYRIKNEYEEWHSRTGKGAADESFCRWLTRLINGQAKRACTILDVGCGTGEWLGFCEKRSMFEYYCGIDISRVALHRAKTRTQLPDFILGDAEHLPFKEASFDIVSCLGSLEHFRDPKKAIKEISRVMIGGRSRSFIFLPNAYFLGHVYLVYRTGEPPDEGGQYFSERFCTKTQWERLLKGEGLQILRSLKYNRITKASRKVSTLVRVLYNLLIAPFLPFNLSYAFLFICSKSEDCEAITSKTQLTKR